jgi:hypothetical protein
MTDSGECTRKCDLGYNVVAWSHTPRTRIAVFNALNETVNKAHRKALNSTVYPFEGFCDKCFVNCDNCTANWFMTPEKICIAECDETYNIKSSVLGQAYMKCSPIPTEIKITCV